jgi:hypothetical protein
MNLNQIHTPNIEEMKNFFDKRTAKHINLVQKYAKKIADTNPKFSKIIEQASKHDSSKYEEPEYTPYLYITWDYKCKDEGKDFKIPDEINDNDATIHHIKHNRHHPEFHDEESGDDSINRNDRDATPEKATDASKMTDIDIAEMVADWCAMSEEKGNSPKSWADKNINNRWNFSDKQSDLIYKLINDIWE